MAFELSPLYAANLASDVYQAVTSPGQQAFIDLYASDMELKQASMVTGVTGGYILKKTHVMAVFSAGKGDYKGQAFIAFKGTASLYDALTDLNAGMRTSHTGQAVHQGFYLAFDSVLADLRKFVGGLNGVGTIHCVGHSLGGAIATLAADFIRASSAAAQVKLYTFGSPRVGLSLFASKCTGNLLADNIYRVHHKTDPVPMLPTWPFMHVPSSDGDYLIDSPVRPLPWEYHLMAHYIESVDEAGSWASILTNRPKGYAQVAVENWLQSDGAVSLTANTLDLMNAAMLYVVEKAIQATGIVLVTSASSGFTLLDRMAMFMARTAQLSVQASTWVHHLMRKLGALIGLVVAKGVDLTVAFIRMVFMRVHAHIAEMVTRISRALR